jgi:folate-binding protein YgfZ
MRRGCRGFRRTSKQSRPDSLAVYHPIVATETRPTSENPTVPDPAQPSDLVLRTAVAWARINPAIVTATGPDAVRFVDNFATAALSPLSVGAGTETFFTDARGWVLAVATVLRTETGLVILAAPEQGSQLRDHLERYHIREAVELVDASFSMSTIVVAGPTAGDQLRQLGIDRLPILDGDHECLQLDGSLLRVTRLTTRGTDGFWLQAETSGIGRFVARLQGAGVPEADSTAMEALRIEACFPCPADIPDKTLPQELGRDTHAISFTKGCYLGQETVARLDAMGHVNRRLALVAIEAAEPPAVPVVIKLEGESVGTLSSVCLSSLLGCPAGLGLVHTRALASGGLRVGTAPARIVAVAGRPAEAPPTSPLQPRDQQ